MHRYLPAILAKNGLSDNVEIGNKGEFRSFFEEIHALLTKSMIVYDKAYKPHTNGNVMSNHLSYHNRNSTQETLDSVYAGTVDWDIVIESLREYGFGLLNEQPLNRNPAQPHRVWTGEDNWSTKRKACMSQSA